MNSLKKFEEYIKEDSITTGSFGSGQAVGGGATGAFTTANGVSTSGGDSGTAFATNSSGNGMGAIISAQPSSTPGDVAGSTKGSGDIGAKGGAFTKQPAYNQERKGKKKDKKMDDKANRLNNMYILKYTDFGNVKKVESVETIKENKYTPPTMIKCKECGVEVEDTLKDMFGHVYLKHWAKPNIQMRDSEAREMVTRFFHDIKDEK